MTIGDPTFALMKADRQVVRTLDEAGHGPFERDRADLLCAIVEVAGLKK